jgi:hypothetical protein
VSAPASASTTPHRKRPLLRYSNHLRGNLAHESLIRLERSHFDPSSGQSPFNRGRKPVDTFCRETEDVEISSTSFNVPPEDERTTASQGKAFCLFEAGDDCRDSLLKRS